MSMRVAAYYYRIIHRSFVAAVGLRIEKVRVGGGDVIYKVANQVERSIDVLSAEVAFAFE